MSALPASSPELVKESRSLEDVIQEIGRVVVGASVWALALGRRRHQA